ncbi:MAG: glycosyltransferase family protein [Phenylobacterium sp.]|uniref:glycosyltransferase family protein n=1 Tax=Phenylobacterium sp. TaxID=1871053 RepID=UPI0025DBB1FC|nr:glycosyltransferase family protein [Phenylobacterium sp.]MCA6223743.1 glycosyltransferase family protein [Phenylobacterium sp.]MCA6231110.1 glycosyltransferase family protein [Phenylobacterium sp.]MCA6258081.1 glycosyltransferase family protein [Phenylobacterium sp.]MCA6262127.1 glycosyltransferase family protein [Phenylobacterium sp.]MCA6265353.1 glycosyltransferase family protein [Phenylobacterium sp.]
MATAILQARMSSSRLPGKVLKPLLGQPMILRQIERLRRCRELDRIVVATSRDASDDILAATLAEAAVEVVRGPLDDVLGRFVQAADALGLHGDLVRLTADCPLADPGVIDACVVLRREGGFDYASNGQVRTYPRGLDVEVFTADVLRRAGREATSAHDREHVTPWIYGPGSPFRRSDLVREPDLSAFRWTVDLPADFDFVERVYAALYPANPAFSSDDVLALPFSRREADA